MMVPLSCPDVPAEALNPKNTWSDQSAFNATASKLARLFVENFASYADGVHEEVRNAGPAVS